MLESRRASLESIAAAGRARAHARSCMCTRVFQRDVAGQSYRPTITIISYRFTAIII